MNIINCNTTNLKEFNTKKNINTFINDKNINLLNIVKKLIGENQYLRSNYKNLKMKKNLKNLILRKKIRKENLLTNFDSYNCLVKSCKISIQNIYTLINHIISNHNITYYIPIIKRVKKKNKRFNQNFLKVNN